MSEKFPLALYGTAIKELQPGDYVANSVFPGIIQMYGGATAPSGWLLCDGSAVSRTTYAALFAVIGTNYGAGDGSTTFLLPDLRSRFPVGAGAFAQTGSGTTGQITAKSLGATGGDERVDVSVLSNMHVYPRLDLSAASPTTTTIPSNTPGYYLADPIKSGATAVSAFTSTTPTTGNAPYLSGLSASVTLPDGTTGAGVSGNLPPFLGVNFIIKI